MTKLFRILPIEDPNRLGPLQSVCSVIVKYEYDPGKPLKTIIDKIQILLTEQQANALAGGLFDQPPYLEALRLRIAFFATNRIKEILLNPNRELDKTIKISEDEFKELLDIDYKRVTYGKWEQVELLLLRPKQQIFISCGQRTIEERELGKRISSLVEEKTGLRGYFAEYQTSLEGLTENIFTALYNSTGFISIMHKRDLINNDKGQYRGSVWIEQEISIASFIVQSLKKSIPSKCYIEKGIIQEGVRGYIILNPIEFSNTQEILDDLELWWPKLRSIKE
jgi:hypothetical protein